MIELPEVLRGNLRKPAGNGNFFEKAPSILPKGTSCDKKCTGDLLNKE